MTEESKKPMLRQLAFEGALLTRGFWLYIWEIKSGDDRNIYYVGRTGDKPSGSSQSPFDRLSKHLGQNKNNNALRRYLDKNQVDPSRCHFRFHAYGPLFTEGSLDHGKVCDMMSGLEKALADAMLADFSEHTHLISTKGPTRFQ
ncbi:MAG: hypothetical protein WCH75_07085 [Candidatus Binatia bacterium]